MCPGIEKEASVSRESCVIVGVARDGAAGRGQALGDHVYPTGHIKYIRLHSERNGQPLKGPFKGNMPYDVTLKLEFKKFMEPSLTNHSLK